MRKQRLNETIPHNALQRSLSELFTGYESNEKATSILTNFRLSIAASDLNAGSSVSADGIGRRWPLKENDTSFHSYITPIKNLSETE